jgi:hypothetical protein
VARRAKAKPDGHELEDDSHLDGAIQAMKTVHDLQATILYLMGIDHEKLTYRYSGRDFRLTDVHGTVLHDILS